jgi:uncharacterized protein with GYD domain
MIIITQGRYTGEAIAGMVERPEDRAKEAKRLIEAAGGKFIASYFTFGEYDFLLITEFEDIRQITPALIAVAAGGSVSGLSTTVALAWDEGKAAFAQAGALTRNFRSAGRKK